MDEGDQGRPEQAAEPVLEAAPPVTARAVVPPTKAMPPTEEALVAAEPTGTGLGMPKELPTMPGPSNVEFNIEHLPED